MKIKILSNFYGTKIYITLITTFCLLVHILRQKSIHIHAYSFKINFNIILYSRHVFQHYPLCLLVHILRQKSIYIHAYSFKINFNIILYSRHILQHYPLSFKHLYNVGFQASVAVYLRPFLFRDVTYFGL